MSSSQRLPLFQLAPDSYAAMRKFAQTTVQSALRAGVAEETVHLVKVRVSQVNACPLCVELHTREARAAGVSEPRLHLLSAWEHAYEYFTEREQAALRLAEAITNVQAGAVSDEVYETARKHYNEDQIAHLIFVSTAMNSWNRLAISARLAPRSPDKSRA
jgi:AhpD family alkylhydroperoxidase